MSNFCYISVGFLFYFLVRNSHAYLEVDPRHPPLIRQWVEGNVDRLQFKEARHDITGRPRFCILQKEEVKQGPQAGSGLRN